VCAVLEIHSQADKSTRAKGIACVRITKVRGDIFSGHDISRRRNQFKYAVFFHAVSIVSLQKDAGNGMFFYPFTYKALRLDF